MLGDKEGQESPGCPEPSLVQLAGIETHGPVWRILRRGEVAGEATDWLHRPQVSKHGAIDAGIPLQQCPAPNVRDGLRAIW